MRCAARQSRRVKLRSHWTQLSALPPRFEWKLWGKFYTWLLIFPIKSHVLIVWTTPVSGSVSLLCRDAAAFVCVSVSFMMSIGIRCLLNLAAREQSEEPDMTWIITLLRVRLKWSCEWLVCLNILSYCNMCVFIFRMIHVFFLYPSLGIQLFNKQSWQ